MENNDLHEDNNTNLNQTTMQIPKTESKFLKQSFGLKRPTAIGSGSKQITQVIKIPEIFKKENSKQNEENEKIKHEADNK